MKIGDLPLIHAEPTQLGMVFQHLIANAIKFRSSVRPLRISNTAKKVANTWRFLIRDNGIGIEQQYLKKILTIFQRLHNKTELSGDGIGLAICKRVISGHGSQIVAESTPNKGSVFSFTIPIKAEDISFLEFAEPIRKAG